MSEVILISINISDLTEIVKRAVNNAFEAKQEISSNSSDRWLDLNELIAFDPEKRSKSTIYAYVLRREIPFHKNGKKLLFLKSEIENWLLGGRKKTSSEITSDAIVALKQSKSNGK
jgi:excisionase family DNA binding protein